MPILFLLASALVLILIFVLTIDGHSVVTQWWQVEGALLISAGVAYKA